MRNRSIAAISCPRNCPGNIDSGGRGLFQITAPPAAATTAARARLGVERLDPLFKAIASKYENTKYGKKAKAMADELERLVAKRVRA